MNSKSVDQLSVPKKVNRHVIKALVALCGKSVTQPVDVCRILAQVKFQMRNLVPVPRLRQVVECSLEQLCRMGVIARYSGNTYAIGSNYSFESIAHSKANIVKKESSTRSKSSKRSRRSLEQEVDNEPNVDFEDDDVYSLTRKRKKPRASVILERNGFDWQLKDVEEPMPSTSVDLASLIDEANKKKEEVETQKEENEPVPVCPTPDVKVPSVGGIVANNKRNKKAESKKRISKVNVSEIESEESDDSDSDDDESDSSDTSSSSDSDSST